MYIKTLSRNIQQEIRPASSEGHSISSANIEWQGQGREIAEMNGLQFLFDFP